MNELLSSIKAQWTEARRGGMGFFLAWRMVTFGLVMLGFLALAFTGELHPLAMIGFVLGWGAGILAIQPPAWWRPWYGRVAIWSFLLVIGIVATQLRFSSILYLLLFLGLYKCLTLRTPSDHLHALLIAFFMFLACTVITTSMSYLFFMLLFVILLMLDLTCWTIAREGDRTLKGGFTPENALLVNPGAPTERAFLSRLFYGSLATGVLVLFMTFGLFLLIPHYSAYRVPNPWARPSAREAAATSGYSDEITFGTLSQLNLDDSKVMEVGVKWADPTDRPLPTALRLRGTVLDQYDEKHWECYQLTGEKDSRSWKEIPLPPLSALHGPLLRQSIIQNTSFTKRLFGAPMVTRYHINRKTEPMPLLNSGWLPPPGGGRSQRGYKLSLQWRTQSLQVMTFNREMRMNSLETIEYQADSVLVEESTNLLRTLANRSHLYRGAPDGDPTPTVANEPDSLTSGTQPNTILTLDETSRRINVQLPVSALTLRLIDISNKRAAAPDVPGKIVQLINWFHTDFEYSLTPKTPYGMHPIEAFLTRTHKGHCEYFATALVLLLRAQGIPARVAIGFYTSEWNPSTQSFTVRQSDAHAWAEVWVDHYGWLTLDPTPADWRGRVSRLTEPNYSCEQFSAMLRSYWQRYVLDYSANQQDRLMNGLLAIRFVQRFKGLIDPVWEAIKSISWFRDKNDTGIRWGSDRLGINLLLLLLAIPLTLLLLFFIFRRRSATPIPQRSPVIFMNTLFERLETLGWKRDPSQTPAELLGRIEHETAGRWELNWLLELYHRCRFASEVPSAADQARVQELLRNLK